MAITVKGHRVLLNRPRREERLIKRYVILLHRKRKDREW